MYLPHSPNTCIFFFFFFLLSYHLSSLKIFFFLAALGLSCSTQDLLLQFMDFVTVVHGLSYAVACRILVQSQPGIKLAIPELQGGFLTTGPPRKSQSYLLYLIVLPLIFNHGKTQFCVLNFFFLHTTPHPVGSSDNG